MRVRWNPFRNAVREQLALRLPRTRQIEGMKVGLAGCHPAALAEFEHNKLSKTRAVVIAHSLRATKGFCDGVGSDDSRMQRIVGGTGRVRQEADDVARRLCLSSAALARDNDCLVCAARHGVVVGPGCSTVDVRQWRLVAG
eukprot:scaffold279657_cov30-Tisochrysis_lutea.AAC.5